MCRCGVFIYLFFEEEDRKELIDVRNIICQTAEACGISTATVKRCRRKQEKGARESSGILRPIRKQRGRVRCWVHSTSCALLLQGWRKPHHRQSPCALRRNNRLYAEVRLHFLLDVTEKNWLQLWMDKEMQTNYDGNTRDRGCTP